MDKKSNMVKILVTADVAPSTRIDKFLSLDEHQLPISRSGLTKLFTDNKVFVNGAPVKKSQKVRAGQEICLELPSVKENSTTGPNPTDIPLDVIHEDDHLVLINKQYGIAVHPGEGEDNDYTLVSGLKFRFGDNLSDGEDPLRPGIVHRLDKDTSGLIVICKTNEAHALMKLKFSERSKDISKVYHTIVVGNFGDDHGVVTNYVKRHPKDGSKMMVTDKNQGKECITEYDVLKRWKIKSAMYNLIKVTLHTGRTHQIRVTMSSLAHPVVGDPLYHKKNAKHNVDKLCLVAKEMKFNHPILEKELSFVAPYPKHMVDFIAYLDSKDEGFEDCLDDFELDI